MVFISCLILTGPTTIPTTMESMMDIQPSIPDNVPLLVVPVIRHTEVVAPPTPPLPKEQSVTTPVDPTIEQSPLDIPTLPWEGTVMSPSAEEETPTGDSHDKPAWEEPVYIGPTPRSIEEYSFFKIDLILESIQSTHQ